MSRPKTKSSLLFTGDDLVPADITRTMECQPTSASRKGDVIPIGSKTSSARTGVWRLQGPEGADLTVDDQVLRLLGQVTNDPGAWSLMGTHHSTEIRIGVFLTSVNQGLQLRPSTLHEIAVRGLSLTLDLYYTAKPEDAQI